LITLIDFLMLFLFFAVSVWLLECICICHHHATNIPPRYWFIRVSGCPPVVMPPLLSPWRRTSRVRNISYGGMARYAAASGACAATLVTFTLFSGALPRYRRRPLHSVRSCVNIRE